MKAYIPAFALPVVCVEQGSQTRFSLFNLKCKAEPSSFTTYLTFPGAWDFYSSKVNNAPYYGNILYV